MKKILSVLLVAVMMFSILSLTVAADTTYSIATDGDGNPLNPYVINNDVWVEGNGGIKMPENKLFSFLLFDTPLTTKRIEATFKDMSLSGSGDDRNGIVFAFTDHNPGATLTGEGDANVSFYWAYITGWGGEYRVAVLKMGKYEGWNMISEGDWAVCGKTFTEIGVENSGEKVKLAAEWDNEGHMKVFVNGVLAHEITDPTIANNGTPLAGNLYGVLTRRWDNSTDPNANRANYTDTLTSFVAGKFTNSKTGDTTVIVSLVALVAAMGTGIVISKKRRFN